MKEGYCRYPHNFPLETKLTVRQQQENRCAVTGEKTKLQIHHILPIALAVGFWPNIDPEILKQIENAVGLSEEIHQQLHREMYKWPDEFLRLFVVGVYKHMRDTYRESQDQYAQAGD